MTIDPPTVFNEQPEICLALIRRARRDRRINRSALTLRVYLYCVDHLNGYEHNPLWAHLIQRDIRAEGERQVKRAIQALTRSKYLDRIAPAIVNKPPRYMLIMPELPGVDRATNIDVIRRSA